MTPVTLSGALLAVVLGCELLTSVPAAADPSTGPSADPVSGLVGGLVGGLLERPPRDEATRAAGAARLRPHPRPRTACCARAAATTATGTALKIRTERLDPGDLPARSAAGRPSPPGRTSADADAKRAPAHFRFCRYNTEPGRFTIRAKLTFYNDSGEHRVWLEPSHFRLRRR